MKTSLARSQPSGKKLKILHVCNRFYPCIGGIETYIMNISKGLIKRGHKSDILCLNKCHNSKTVLPPDENYCGMSIFRVPYIDLKYYLVASSFFRRIKDYDIVHVHGLGFFSDFLAITKPVHNKNMVLSVYGGVFHTQDILLLKKIYFFGWCRLILKNFKKIIAISPEDKDTVFKISKNVFLVDAGIDYNHFSSIKKNVQKNILIYVGRISKNKRIDNLIKTMVYLKKEVPDIILYIVGDDWENLKKDLEEIVKEYGLEKNVIFTGKVSDSELLNYLSRANLLLSASEYESFGLSVVEAMAAGCIPVLNNIEIFSNLINDGIEGFVVDFTKHEDAAKRLSDILRRNLDSLRKKSIVFSKKYDWNEKIILIERIYLNAYDCK